MTAERLRDGLWMLRQPKPGADNNPYTLCYLLADDLGGVHVIDPGWGTDQNLIALLDAARTVGGEIRTATVTHLHGDHLGLAHRVRNETGASVVLGRVEQDALGAGQEDLPLDLWGVPTEAQPELVATPHIVEAFTADRLLDDGELLDIPGWSIQAIATPGHTSGHLCFHDPQNRLLFSGDHVLPGINPGLGLGGASGTNPLADYLNSLERIKGFDDHEVLPGHERIFTGLAARCDELAAHHLRRTREVASALERDQAATIWEIATTLTWSSGWAGLHGVYLRSALAQTAMHADYVRAGGLG